MIKIRYALSRTSDDHFPIHFDLETETTISNWLVNSEELIKTIERLDHEGYDLFNSLEEIQRAIQKRRMSDVLI